MQLNLANTKFSLLLSMQLGLQSWTSNNKTHANERISAYNVHFSLKLVISIIHYK